MYFPNPTCPNHSLSFPFSVPPSSLSFFYEIQVHETGLITIPSAWYTLIIAPSVTVFSSSFLPSFLSPCLSFLLSSCNKCLWIYHPKQNLLVYLYKGFPVCSAGKESACNAGDPGSISGLGRSPGEGNGYPLQYSGLENSMDCVVHGVAKSRTGRINFHFHTCTKPNLLPQEISHYIYVYPF